MHKHAYILIQDNTRKSDNLIETDYFCVSESSIFRFIYWNPKDLTEAEDIKKRWQEYTDLYKKGLNDLGNHYGVVTHLGPDILKCEVKWNLGSTTMNKARGDYGIPAELFQILKDDSVKVLHSICQQIWKTQQHP